MGLLETRNLDFRNVIMLSVNEGQMPKGDKRSSLIPYTLRAAYGMTTIEREVSLYAYYYYRLLQRAEHITLLYNVSTENGNKGEMSRFMLQTLAEADDLFGKGQEISLRAFTASSETQAAEPYSVVKTADVMKLFQARFSGERMLSPSAINTYMQCPLKFYFSHVMGIRPDKDVTEDVDKSTFGTIFHESMQQLYEPHVGKPFRSADAWALASDESLIVQKLNTAFSAYYPLPLNGTQLINRHVIKQFIINQIKADARMADELEIQGGYWQIISQEQKYSIPLPPLTAQLSTLNYNFGGYIDRLDLLHTPAGDHIRIVDYKTSNKPQTAKTIEELFDTQKCTNNYHIMQTLCYCTILTNPHCQPQLAALNPQPSALSPQLVPALMYCAKEDEKNYSGIIQLAPTEGAKKETMEDFKTQYAEAFNTLLYEKIKEIFTSYDENPEHGTFAQCTDEQNCAHCDFLAFCRRHPQKRY
jgi:CRISPR/Cas system-associated exonuclease Cas4 (RecB family)